MKNVALFIAVCILMSMFLVACSTDTAPATFESTQALPQPSRTPPPTATTAPPATRTPIPQPTASPTRPAPTVTEAIPDPPLPTVAIPGDWRVLVVGIPLWSAEGSGGLDWIGPDRLSFRDQDDRIHLVSAETGSAIAVATPTPDPHSPEGMVSMAQEYQILCRPDGLQMIHTADQRLIAEAALAVEYCGQVVWASDGTAAAVMDDAGDVYLWLTDGSAPRKLGHSAWHSYPVWSPDDSQLLLLDQLDGNLNSELASFSIAYRDGRPLFEPNTPIDFGNHWEEGLGWVTNTIIRNRKAGIDWSDTDYYDARTGRFIIRNSISEAGGRRASVSPDDRWMVLEASQQDTDWNKRGYPYWDAELNPILTPVFDSELVRPGLMVINLDTLRRSLVIQSNPPPEKNEYFSDSLKYLGWNADSSRFFFIHYPLGFPSYDLPVGLLAMNPVNGYIEPVLPEVADGLVSPDHEHIFVVTAETMEEYRADGLAVGMYRLDGTPVGAPQPLVGAIEFDALNAPQVYWAVMPLRIPAAWSPDGRRLAYADRSGNLWLMDTAGNTTLLASNLREETRDGRVRFTWSPDEHFLLIKSTAHAWIADIAAGRRFPGEVKTYYCSTLVQGSEGTWESPYDCGGDAKVAGVIDLVCKQGGGKLYVHHSGMTSNFYEVFLVFPDCDVHREGEFDGSPPLH